MALFDLLGRAWAMGIIWQLEDGPHTFRKLRTKCDDVSPSLLNRRLKELRTTGLVELGDDGYLLTPLGGEAYELLEPLGRWAKHWADTIS
jgi:DNA-binding HxlR family transcriptional regulator